MESIEVPMPAPVAVTIVDQVPGGGRQVACTLQLWSERITARDLIAKRVRHEIDAYNADTSDLFFGLVQPTDAERSLNGWRVKNVRPIDVDAQIAAACEAFSAGRILLLVDDRQVETLDDAFALTRDAEICFYKLVPLVGG
jgi:hypothetical protein